MKLNGQRAGPATQSDGRAGKHRGRARNSLRRSPCDIFAKPPRATQPRILIGRAHQNVVDEPAPIAILFGLEFHKTLRIAADFAPDDDTLSVDQAYAGLFPIFGVAEKPAVARLVELGVAHELDDLFLRPASPENQEIGFDRRQLFAVGTGGIRSGSHVGLTLLDAGQQALFGRFDFRGGIELRLHVLELLDGRGLFGLGRLSAPFPAGIGALSGHDFVVPELGPRKVQEFRRQGLTDQGHIGWQSELGDLLAETVEIEIVALDRLVQSPVDIDVVAGDGARAGQHAGVGCLPVADGNRLGLQIRATKLVAAGADAEGHAVAGTDLRIVRGQLVARPVHRIGGRALKLQLHMDELRLPFVLIHRSDVQFAGFNRPHDLIGGRAIRDRPNVREIQLPVIHFALVLQDRTKREGFLRQQEWGHE